MWEHVARAGGSCSVISHIPATCTGRRELEGSTVYANEETLFQFIIAVHYNKGGNLMFL